MCVGKYMHICVLRMLVYGVIFVYLLYKLKMVIGKYDIQCKHNTDNENK